jgi:hypothetical protein
MISTTVGEVLKGALAAGHTPTDADDAERRLIEALAAHVPKLAAAPTWCCSTW